MGMGVGVGSRKGGGDGVGVGVGCGYGKTAEEMQLDNWSDGYPPVATGIFKYRRRW